MTDLDRYITDEAVQAAKDAALDPYAHVGTAHTVRGVLAAALPHIAPQIRADTLREAADQYEDTSTDEWLSLAQKLYRPGGPNMPSIWLRLKADRPTTARCDEVHPQQDIHHPGGHPAQTRALADEAVTE